MTQRSNLLFFFCRLHCCMTFCNQVRPGKTVEVSTSGRRSFVVVMQCPDGMIPVDNACACQPTCDNPSATSYCPWPDTEKCVCPDGKILFNGHCVSCCGCIDSSGVVYEVRIGYTSSENAWSYRTFL